MAFWESAEGRGWTLAVGLVLLATVAVILLERGAGPEPAAVATAPAATAAPSSSLGRSVAAVARAHGMPAPVAECAARRVTLDGELGPGASVAAIEAHARAAAIECSGAYSGNLAAGERLPAADSTAGPMSAEWQEFARRVDEICAVDYNKELADQATIEAVADSRHWSEARTEAVMHYGWAESQAETHRLVAALGPPPARAALLARWNANVALRGRLFRDLGDAWLHREAARSERIWSRITALKAEANRLGQRFGLRVCTSN